MVNFDLTKEARMDILEEIISLLDQHYDEIETIAVAPELVQSKIENALKNIELHDIKDDPLPIIRNLIDDLKKYTVHTTHPMYYGLYNPRANFASILADLIIGYFNPQLAAWSHAPYANEIESLVIRQFGNLFGYPKDQADGVFASGGAEANLTAMVCALHDKIDDFHKLGLTGSSKIPKIYCSSEAHHSINKAARITGLGTQSVRLVNVSKKLELEISHLDELVEEDLEAGHFPMMIIGTAGTTGAGTIDPLPKIAEAAKRHDAWYHVDAAWGGAAILSQNLRKELAGIEQADSITFDAHKWLSVPMGTSLFITSRKDILSKSFGMRTEYMPKEAERMAIVDPYTHSIQWSRRSLGLRVFLSIAVFGWRGYEQIIDHQARVGRYLRDKLTNSNWMVMNHTPLPVVCFTHVKLIGQRDLLRRIVDQALSSGETWISIYPINDELCIRACITNYNTTDEHVDKLVELLDGLLNELLME